jgi:hypothetical protein
VPLTWTRHLTCPKCGGQFDYELVPGGSFTSIRLGTSRYMRCPLCHRFSVFSMKPSAAEVPPAPGAEAAPASEHR